jgi:hypothetical protein
MIIDDKEANTIRYSFLLCFENKVKVKFLKYVHKKVQGQKYSIQY